MIDLKEEWKLIEWEEGLKYKTEEELEKIDRLMRKMLCRVIDEKTYRLVGTNNRSNI
jgi:hypothetical protein